MSVERVERQDGSVVWRVRWRRGGSNRSKVLGRKWRLHCGRPRPDPIVEVEDPDVGTARTYFVQAYVS